MMNEITDKSLRDQLEIVLCMHAYLHACACVRVYTITYDCIYLLYFHQTNRSVLEPRVGRSPSTCHYGEKGHSNTRIRKSVLHLDTTIKQILADLMW